MIQLSRLLCPVVLFLAFPSWSPGQIRLDFRKHLIEKHGTAELRRETILVLVRAGYQIVEMGEDYCIWFEELKEYQTSENRFRLLLTIRITGPSLFFEKEPIMEENVSVEYLFLGSVNQRKGSPLKAFRNIKSTNEKSHVRAQVLGEYLAAKISTMVGTYRYYQRNGPHINTGMRARPLR